MTLLLVILAASSLIAAGIIFKHKRLFSFIASALIIFEAHWLLLTIIDRTIALASKTSNIYLGGSIILLLFWMAQWRLWTFPRWLNFKDVIKDIGPGLILVVVLASAAGISFANGWQPDGTFITHGFFNGDTATFTSLVQKSMGSVGLVNNNPFAGNGYLEYPTLLHAGVAEFLTAVLPSAILGSGWFAFLPLMNYVFILASVPLLFLLWDVAIPEPSEAWQAWLGTKSRLKANFLQTIIVLYILSLSWESFVYPQGHFFLMGLFFLLVALLLKSQNARGAQHWLLIGLAQVITLELLMSNAVTGTAAVVLTTSFWLLGSNSKKLQVPERALSLLAALFWIGLFLVNVPGESAFGRPGFSYTAALDMLRLAPVLLLIFIGLLQNVSKHTLMAVMVTALVSVSYITFIFSSRDIIVANASRFLYHAILVGFPLAIYPLTRGIWWLRRELLQTSHTLAELITGWAVVTAVAGFYLLPALASVASTFDNLLWQDEQRISSLEQGALQWINNNTSADAIFLASPDAPWSIPIFTGRAIVRTNYWLSPKDALLDDIRLAYTGNSTAQKKVQSEADYLYLRAQDKNWKIYPATQPVFKSAAVTIWKLN